MCVNLYVLYVFTERVSLVWGLPHLLTILRKLLNCSTTDGCGWSIIGHHKDRRLR